MKLYTIYCHTHAESGRRYIGLTVYSLQHRWNQHCSQAKNSKGCSHFAASIRKYGKDAFSHEVLAMSWDLESANATEEALIEQYQTRDPQKGFNLMKGGAHTPHPVKNPWDRPEYRKKYEMIWKDPSYRAALTAATIAATNTPEIRAKRSETRKKQWKDPLFREKASKANRRNGEVRTRINASVKQSMTRPEYREARSKLAMDNWARSEYQEKVRSSNILTWQKKLQDPDYISIKPTCTETHKICKKHGPILFEECHKHNKNGKTYYECNHCNKIRNNAAYSRKVNQDAYV